MTDIAQGELSTGGQLVLLYSAGAFFLLWGHGMLVNVRRSRGKTVNDWRVVNGFSARGDRETQGSMWVIGSAFAVVGLGIVTGG
ncbi:hypothetical protein [Streptomyces tubercidicus]|uniref:hypothetical protein n=1 Tax=Streptomyces tubercidicus TaxID=47759 RepID=UPI003466E4E9